MKTMTYLSFLLLLLVFSDTASAVDEQICFEQGQGYGSPQGDVFIDPACHPLFEGSSLPAAREVSLDGNVKIVGYKNIIFAEVTDTTLVPPVTNLYPISGQQSQLNEIHGVEYDATNLRITVLANTEKYVYTYYLNVGGNIAPIRQLENGELSEATGIAMDLQNNQLIVLKKSLGQLDFYKRSADIDGKSVETEMDLQRSLAGGATQLVSPVDATVSATRSELYIYDEFLKQILVFNSTASGDTAPLRALNVNETALGTVSKIDYDLGQDKIRITDQSGATVWISP